MKNKDILLKERLATYLLAVPITIISLFVKHDAKIVIFSSFLNKYFDSNSKYLFLWFIKNMKNYKCFFVINDGELRKKLTGEIGDYFIETKTLKGKVFALHASTWFVSSLESPVGGFWGACNNRIVIHLGHGTPLKNIGLLEKRLSFIKKIYYGLIRTNISYAVASSIYFKKIIAEFIGLSENRVLIAGQARNDSLFVKCDLAIKKGIRQKNKKNILYVPTWRQSSKIRLFPFDDFSTQEMTDFLCENKINIFIRLHPVSVLQKGKGDIEIDVLKMPNIFSFSATIYPEIMDYLNEFDLLITDYSSIYFDYLLLNRPLVFLPYDYDVYEKKIGFTVPYGKFTPGYKPSNMKEFMNAIYSSLYGEDEFEDERKKINKICNSFQRENCREFVKILYDNKILTMDGMASLPF
jgi:CDP-glycerol glycerophosphotransferase